MMIVTIAPSASRATRRMEMVYGSGNLLRCPFIMCALQLDEADDRLALDAADYEPVAVLLSFPPRCSLEIEGAEALLAGEDDLLLGPPIADAGEVLAPRMLPGRKDRSGYFKRAQAIHGYRSGSRAWPLCDCILLKDLR